MDRLFSNILNHSFRQHYKTYQQKISTNDQILCIIGNALNKKGKTHVS